MEKRNVALVHLDDAFTVNGVGTVVSGVITRGSISTNQLPHGTGFFRALQRSRRQIDDDSSNVHSQSCVWSIREFRHKSKKQQRTSTRTRKGMALICKSRILADAVVRSEILIFVSPTTLTVGYAPVLHCMSVRQCARICKIEGKDVLRAGDRAKVVFQWLYRPEFAEEGFRKYIKAEREG